MKKQKRRVDGRYAMIALPKEKNPRGPLERPRGPANASLLVTMITIAKLASARPHSVSTAGTKLSEIDKRDTRRDRFRDGKSLRHFRNLPHQRELREIRAASLRQNPTHTLNPNPTLTPQDRTLLSRIQQVRARYASMPSVRRELARQYPRWRTPPVWEKATFVLKAPWWHQAVSKDGGVAFRVNFNPDLIAKAAKSRRGLFCVLKDRIRNELKRAFGHDVPFWCALDETEDGRLHIQGGLAISDNEHQKAKEALQRAGGRWQHKQGQEHQAWLGGPSYLSGEWASYCTRKTASLEERTGQSATYASAPIKKRAEAMYARDREALMKFHCERA